MLLYALGANIWEKLDGIAISAMFIAGIVIVSLVSRVTRTTELRAVHIEFDEAAHRFVTDSLAHEAALNIVANQRRAGDTAKEAEQRGLNPVPGAADVLFLEIDVVDPSQFSNALRVLGVQVDGYRILRADSPAVPNAIAATLLALRDATRRTATLLLRMGRGQPGRAPAALPHPRRGRHRPGGTRCTASTAAQQTRWLPCLVIRPRCTLVSDSRCLGVIPAQEHSCCARRSG